MIEVEINSNVLIYRVTGGIFDFYLFVGDTPSSVIIQYHTLIGTTFMPPYWSYGFQLSKWGYKDLDEVKTVVDRTVKLGIPFEMQYIDIDYMERALDFTVAQQFQPLDTFINELHEKDLKMILIFDPAICTEPYQDPDKEYEELFNQTRLDLD